MRSLTAHGVMELKIVYCPNASVPALWPLSCLPRAPHPCDHSAQRCTARTLLSSSRVLASQMCRAKSTSSSESDLRSQAGLTVDSREIVIWLPGVLCIFIYLQSSLNACIYHICDLQGPSAGGILSPAVHGHKGPVAETVGWCVPLSLCQQDCGGA